MWNIGFQKYLKEILAAFLGEVSYYWEKGTFSIQEDGESLLVQIVEGENTYQAQLTYEEMYQILVPDNKSMAYLYLFQDVTDELKEEDAKEMMVKSYLNKLLAKMSAVFIGRKDKMELLAEEEEIFEEETERCFERSLERFHEDGTPEQGTPEENTQELFTLELVPGYRFTHNGVEYEQMALF